MPLKAEQFLKRCAMRVFVTGASGFIGSNLVPELIDAGHQVVGLTRSERGAQALARVGAEICLGDVNDPACLREALKSVDSVIHTAFHHDFANLKLHSENDRKVIQTLGKALSGSGRALIITSGTGLVRRKAGQLACEGDAHLHSNEFPRAATEEAVDEFISSGDNAMIVRLPQVHDLQRQGRLALHIQLARRKGWVAYIDEGANCVPAAHVSDVARLYRLVLENGKAGCHYHAVSEEGVPMRAIAEVIGDGLKIPVRSIARRDATDYFGELANLAAMDMDASSILTRQRLDWHPSGPDLLTDLRGMDYSA
jgi:nucleoside-diphosphate-sugar epimerase